jgi:hypothetical protein
MGRYRKAAPRIAKQVVGCHHKNSGEELTSAAGAKKLAENLQEFVDDVNGTELGYADESQSLPRGKAGSLHNFASVHRQGSLTCLAKVCRISVDG